ncbi:hypothetical protein [Chryseobacterium aquaticum]|uniref:hypothetical protein n=1 Tax=Chryseobacterium aquaticum TaxID=452084 RepID=UPI003F70964C
MKNLFKFACILNFLLTGFVFGQDLKSLKKDQTFINYLKKETDVIQKINPENFEKIISIVKDKEISENEKEDLAKYFGFKNFENYSSFVNEQHTSLKRLNRDYNLANIDPSTLASGVLDSPEIYPIIDSSQQTYGDDCSKSCVRTGRNCRTQAIAVGIIEQIGCAAIDSFGIGVVCHAIAATNTASELDECDNQQGSCLRGCKK